MGSLEETHVIIRMYYFYFTTFLLLSLSWIISPGELNCPHPFTASSLSLTKGTTLNPASAVYFWFILYLQYKNKYDSNRKEKIHSV